MNKSRQSQYLIFLAGDVHFAIDVFDVIEIILPSKIDNASLKGGALNRIKYQGEELLLLYANKLLFQSPADCPSDCRILIIEQGAQKLALAVTSAEEILHISNDCLKEAGRKSPGLNFELLQGAIEQDDQVVYVIDVPPLFNMSGIAKRSGAPDSD